MNESDLGATFDVDRDLFPFTSRFMEMSNGAMVHYVDEGKGDVTFLMLHGNPTWSFLYRKLISGLTPDQRCVALDYPGFGLSTASAGFNFTAASHYKVVSEFVERLGVESRWAWPDLKVDQLTTHRPRNQPRPTTDLSAQ